MLSLSHTHTQGLNHFNKFYLQHSSSLPSRVVGFRNVLEESKIVCKKYRFSKTVKMSKTISFMYDEVPSSFYAY